LDYKTPVPAKKDYRALCLRVAALLQKERERQEVSMTVLSERAGLSQPSLSYIERGMRIPNLDTLLRIADALGIELSSVLAEATKTAKTAKRGKA
jgi:transcriptional regulator with XRE-family HTH domain